MELRCISIWSSLLFILNTNSLKCIYKEHTNKIRSLFKTFRTQKHFNSLADEQKLIVRWIERESEKSSSAPPASSINAQLQQNGPVERNHRVNMLLCPCLADTDSIDVVLLSFYSTFDRDNAHGPTVHLPPTQTQKITIPNSSNQSQIYYITYTNAFTIATKITYKPNISHQKRFHL